MKPYYQDGFATLYLADSGDLLSGLGTYDLLLTDPPYGLNGGNVGSRSRNYGPRLWDQVTTPALLAEAIARCKNAIVFGGNYYQLPPSACWLVWDKEINGQWADCELAWTNLLKPARIYRHRWNGFARKNNEPRFHPSQKPVDVMSWCIEEAGADIRTILDPFAGSGSTLVAAKLRNIKAVGIEREEMYCEIAANRLAQEVFALTSVPLVGDT